MAGEHGENSRVSLDPVSFGLIAACVAGVLAMVTTWFLAAYFPIPDNDAVFLGLLGFLFIVLLDLLLILGPVISKLRQGQSMAAIKGSVSFFLLGLLVALVVGSLPLLWQRLMAAVPGLQDVPWGAVLTLWIAANSLWMSRGSAQDKHGYSRGRLITQGGLAALIFVAALFLAIARFSGGGGWFGALYLAVALLYGVLASRAFAELWKRRANPPEGMLKT